MEIYLTRKHLSQQNLNTSSTLFVEDRILRAKTIYNIQYKSWII
jgi:hypothetical protein